MDENKNISSLMSWNPLNYSQNLCVIQNANAFQLNSISRSSSQQMSHQLSQQMSHQLSQQICEQNSSQSLLANEPSVRPKSQQMPYNENEMYAKVMPVINLSQSESSHQSCRQMRSIRSRNSTNHSIESLNKLNYYLEKCYEQFKQLEKERKKIEFDLSQAFSGHKISSANNIPIQRIPPNATKIDRLITDMSREHAKVITIIAKMEQLRGDSELNELIHNSIQKWLEMIRKLQMKRKDELLSNTGNFSNSGLITEAFVEEMSEIVKELSITGRMVRTSLWSAYVCTLYEHSLQ